MEKEKMENLNSEGNRVCKIVTLIREYWRQIYVHLNILTYKRVEDVKGEKSANVKTADKVSFNN
jgi:hypothetical protein